jgi:hypothetical protein
MSDAVVVVVIQLFRHQLVRETTDVFRGYGTFGRENAYRFLLVIVARGEETVETDTRRRRRRRRRRRFDDDDDDAALLLDYSSIVRRRVVVHDECFTTAPTVPWRCEPTMGGGGDEHVTWRWR